MKALTNASLARLPPPADLPLAVFADDFVFADELHAFADELHRQRVVADANALVIGHEIPALQGVAGDLRRVRPLDVAGQPHRRLFQADADQLHAIVGFDHHLGEVRLRRNAADGDHLHAEPSRSRSTMNCSCPGSGGSPMRPPSSCRNCCIRDRPSSVGSIEQ